MIALEALLDFLLFGLSYFVPKKNGRYLFGADLGTLFKGNPKYVYLYLLDKDPQIPCWITENKKVSKELSSRNFPVVYKYSLGGFLEILRSEYLFIDFTPRDIFYLGETTFGRFNFIQLTHGTPFKKGGQFAIDEGRGRKFKINLFDINKIISKIKISLVYKVLLNNYKMVLSTSEETQKSSEYLFQNKNVQIIGMPRNDIFFNRELIFNDLSKDLNLKQYDKVILYAPTYRDDYKSVSPLSDEYQLKLDSYLRKSNQILYIKKHPLDSAIVLSDDLSNIRIITHKVDDIQELLVHADILITDYSSVTFDFVMTDRPIIFYPYDYEDYIKNCRGFLYDYFEELPGPFARNEDKLMDLIKTVQEWFSEREYQSKYRSFKNKFNKYHDGKASERCVNYFIARQRGIK